MSLNLKMSQPRKRKPKSKKLNVSSREKWDKILRDVEKNNVPINLLDYIVVNLIDGTQVSIDIQELLAEGMTPDEIEKALETRFETLDFLIKDVDFYVNIDQLAKVVQPITDGFLKDL